jgi:ATP-dependent exoDNAse (exonuclease V) beta subunit
MEEFARSRYGSSAGTTTCSSTSSRTPAARSGSCSRCSRTRGAKAPVSRTAGAIQPSDLHRWRPQAVDLPRFRDADVSILREAARHLAQLRPAPAARGGRTRRAPIDLAQFPGDRVVLSFVNDLCHDLDKAVARRDAFVYGEEDRFPLDTPGPDPNAVALIAGATPEDCAESTAEEIARLIAASTLIRDRDTGLARPVRASDVAILFRARDSHREFEDALERRGLPAYVYKGLGFFDTDEIKDVRALLSYLADPLSGLRAAAWLRSRFVRLSDEGLRRLAPALADALMAQRVPATVSALEPEDADALLAAREASQRWRALVDRMPPAELLDLVLDESAYLVETRGPRARQARENLKKMRAMIRRLQNRGYTTLDRIVSHLDRLALGDEANAVIDASDAGQL